MKAFLTAVWDFFEAWGEHKAKMALKNRLNY